MRPSVQQPISMYKNVMAWERKHYLKKQLFDFDVNNPPKKSQLGV
jgi:hypothetical protein